MLVDLVLFLVTLSITIYFYLTRHYGYWKKKGVAFIEPKFPLGIVHDQFFGIRDAGATNLIYYDKFKAEGLKYAGTFLFHIPTLLIFDLNLCRQLLTKDFNHFVNRDFTPTTHEYISKHLFALEGQDWRNMRVKLSPTFTSGKMKNMFPLLAKCTQHLQEYIDEVVLDEGEFIVKDLILRFTTDVIGSCAFGLEVNSVKHPENEFYQITKLVFEPRKSIFFRVLMQKNFPKLSKLLGINFYHPRITKVLTQIMKDNVQYRKESGIKRNDFIDLLIAVRENKLTIDDEKDISLPESGVTGDTADPENNGKAGNDRPDKESLTLEEMTAQSFVFFAAGFETAASTTSFSLYELAMNMDVQDRLRKEIDQVLSRHDGQISYQALQEMTYMDQVVNEALRRYASFPVLTRVCTKTYKMEDTGLVIDKGVRVHVPSFAIHHDPEIYPDPFKFDPERFSETNSKGRHPYAFLPFGEGPRNCIGMRFGRIQVKTGLASILSKYEVSPGSDTPSRLRINPTMIVTTPNLPFKLKISKRTDM